jgi:hypothetical protein
VVAEAVGRQAALDVLLVLPGVAVERVDGVSASLASTGVTPTVSAAPSMTRYSVTA